MGKAYKLFEKAAYWALDWGYDGGKEIDNEREKKEYDVAYMQVRSCINFKEFDNRLDSALEQARGMYAGGGRAKKARHSE